MLAEKSIHIIQILYPYMILVLTEPFKKLSHQAVDHELSYQAYKNLSLHVHCIYQSQTEWHLGRL